MPKSTRTQRDPRDRIIDAASSLLHDEGQPAVTTRRVAELAGVQAPVIYRLFGDKDGLLDAVTEDVMTRFTATKTEAVSSAKATKTDPVADLRAGWDMTIDFGLANPDLFVLLNNPARTAKSSSAQRGIELLAERVHRVASAGRLRVGEEEAVELIHAAGTGAVFAILARPEAGRDRGLADTLFDALFDRIVTDGSPSAGRSRARRTTKGAPDVVAHAVALRANSRELDVLSSGERALFAEWLDRIIENG